MDTACVKQLTQQKQKHDFDLICDHTALPDYQMLDAR